MQVSPVEMGRGIYSLGSTNPREYSPNTLVDDGGTQRGERYRMDELSGSQVRDGDTE